MYFKNHINKLQYEYLFFKKYYIMKKIIIIKIF